MEKNKYILAGVMKFLTLFIQILFNRKFTPEED